MAALGAILLLVSLIGLLLGLIKPSLAIWWGVNRTRAKVAVVYGLVFVASIVLTVAGAPSDLEAGKAALDRKDYQEATQRLGAVEKSDPGYAEAQRLLPVAQHAYLLAKLEAAGKASAARDYAKVVELLSDYPPKGAGSMDAAKLLGDARDALAQASREKEERAAEAARAGQKQGRGDTAENAKPAQDEESDTDGESGFAQKLKSLAGAVEWDYSKEDSPFDGPIFNATKVFKSDKYAAQMTVHLKCVQEKKSLTIEFMSHVFDADGNTLESSAFDNLLEMSGEPVAVQGRVKWANQPTKPFTALLAGHNNLAVLAGDSIPLPDTQDSVIATNLKGALPAFFELSNGAGDFTLDIPAGNSSVDKVLAACQ